MKNSWKLGNLAGIDLFVHWSFLILPIWIGVSYLTAGGGLGTAFIGVLFLLTVFGCVVLHELGHALMARQFGIDTRDITLLPIGGVARLERMPERPVQELAVALAGPAVNAAIAAALFLVVMLYGGWGGRVLPFNVGGSFLVQLILANVILVAFNLLPAFPMDGGRVLRACLAMFLPRVTATRIASTVGQVLAVGLAIVGLMTNWMLMLVAGFVFVAARNENRFVELQASMQGAIARDAMMDRFHVVPSGARLVDVARDVLMTPQADFPVVENRTVVGMLSKNDVLQMMADGHGERTVSEAMWNKVPSVTPYDRLDDCFGQFQAEGWTSAAVFDAGRLVGLITFENLTRWLHLRPVLAHAMPCEARRFPTPPWSVPHFIR